MMRHLLLSTSQCTASFLGSVSLFDCWCIGGVDWPFPFQKAWLRSALWFRFVIVVIAVRNLQLPGINCSCSSQHFRCSPPPLAWRSGWHSCSRVPLGGAMFLRITDWFWARNRPASRPKLINSLPGQFIHDLHLLLLLLMLLFAVRWTSTNIER